MNTLKMAIHAVLLEQVTVGDEDAIISIINTHLPKIKIDVRKGQIDKWWSDGPMPFDYGELPEYINPVDDMGWDIIIAPDSRWNQPGLKVAGIVRYKKTAKKKGKSQEGNNKIILAFNGHTTQNDKDVLTKFFNKHIKEFYKPEFFDTKSKLPEDDKSTTTPGWEGATFKLYKLTRVADEDYVGMGVGKVARQSFDGTWGQKEDRRR